MLSHILIVNDHSQKVYHESVCKDRRIEEHGRGVRHSAGESVHCIKACVQRACCCNMDALCDGKRGRVKKRRFSSPCFWHGLYISSTNGAELPSVHLYYTRNPNSTLLLVEQL